MRGGIASVERGGGTEGGPSLWSARLGCGGVYGVEHDVSQGRHNLRLAHSREHSKDQNEAWMDGGGKSGRSCQIGGQPVKVICDREHFVSSNSSHTHRPGR